MKFTDLSRTIYFPSLIVISLINISFGQEGRAGGDFSNSRSRDYDIRIQHNNPLRSVEYNEEIDSINDRRCLPDLLSEQLHSRRVKVETRYGVVVGLKVYLCDGPWVLKRNRLRPGGNRQHRTVNVFLGIPYARPPNDVNLRFKPPEEPVRSGEILAFSYKPGCLQNGKYYGPDSGIRTVDEDCLYLNIFSPTQENKYPVIIYIHGGEWDHGSGSTFPGHMLAASQDVIVVTFNYRLGHLGFLATEDKASSGNYGMLDQVMAIKWVYNNIHSFYGDRNNITLYGVGTGAASVGLHALSPLSKYMIQRVIAQSGSALADWAVIRDPQHMYNTTQILKELIGCPVHSSKKLLECLAQRKEADVRKLKIKPRIGWLPWGPVVDMTSSSDKRFLPYLTEDALSSHTMRFDKDFAYLTGVTKDEAVPLILDDTELKSRNYDIGEDIFNKKIKEFMDMYNYTINSEAIFNALTFMYKPWSDPSNKTLLRQEYINMLSDRYYVAPNDKIIKLLLKKNVRTYMYVLNYTIKGLPRPHWQGVPHDIEYYFITGAPFMPPEFYPKSLKLSHVQWTDADRDMSEFFMTAWANFARNGNPTPTKLFNTIFWEEMALNNLQHLNLNGTDKDVSMEVDYRTRESQFWNDYFPSLINREPPTLAPVLEPWVEERSVYRAALWGSIAGAILFLLLTLVFCTLFCKNRRYDSY